MKVKIVIILLVMATEIQAQGLFENAGDEENKQENQIINMTGYIRGVSYIGESSEEKGAEIKNLYGEATLKIQTKKMTFGDAFSEIRIKNGYNFGDEIKIIDLREAYINVYAGKFDFRVGKQIVVWGRADGFNPTNNITSQDFTVFSPEADDSRLGNFLIRSKFHINTELGLEAIWIPHYKASVLPLGIMPLPEGFLLGESLYPNANLNNSGYAAKFNFNYPKIDGSISYFNGYNPLPGLEFGIPVLKADSTFAISISNRAYKQQVIGADFSTVVGGYGLRGELAYRITEGNYEEMAYISNPDIRYVFGIDKTIGNFNLIAQYIGRYVIDFVKLKIPSDSTSVMNYENNHYNRLFAGQTNEVIHSVSIRPALNLFYDMLTIETFGMYNITTDEFLLVPKITYSISDNLKFSIGANYYHGKENSLYDLMSTTMSSGFFELKASF
jgi:hypothetical protein